MSGAPIRDELREARENRGAAIALMVFTPAHAPAGIAPFDVSSARTSTASSTRRPPTLRSSRPPSGSPDCSHWPAGSARSRSTPRPSPTRSVHPRAARRHPGVEDAADLHGVGRPQRVRRPGHAPGGHPDPGHGGRGGAQGRRRRGRLIRRRRTGILQQVGRPGLASDRTTGPYSPRQGTDTLPRDREDPCPPVN